MSGVPELVRFTLVRDAQKVEPQPDTTIPLVPPGAATPQVLTELADAHHSESVQAICANFLAAGHFKPPEPDADLPIWELSRWLRERADRVSRAEVLAWLAHRDADVLTRLAHRDIASKRDSSGTEIWAGIRAEIGASLVVAMLVPDADPAVPPALNRLLLVGGLAELVLRPRRPATERDGAGEKGTGKPETDTGAEVWWALHRRKVLLPTWLSRYPERTERTEAGLLRSSKLARTPAVSDYYVVEDEWNRYEAAEIAHIENVLPHESKKRVHRRETETEQTTTTDTERTTETEVDTQQTDRGEFSRQTQRESELAFEGELSVDTTGQYGPTNVKTHLAATVDGSLAEAEQTAYKTAKEIVSRSVSKVSERTRTVRVTRTFTRITETNRHGLDNTEDEPIVGIYRWVEQVRRLRVLRYPNRFLLEFLVPEPAAWWRWLDKSRQGKGLITTRPDPFTADAKPKSDTNPELTPADINPNTDTYLKYAARYGATGLEPVPADQTVATVISRYPPLKQEKDGIPVIVEPKNEWTLEWNSQNTLTVPAGWRAKSWRAAVLAWHDGHFPEWQEQLSITISVGAGQAAAVGTTAKGSALVTQISNGAVGPISSGTVPVAVMLDAPYGYVINVELICEPTAAAIQRWRQATYEVIRGAYDLKLQEHLQELAASSIRAGIDISGMSPARAREVERTELKKHVLTLLSGQSPAASPDPWAGDEKGPWLDVSKPPRDEVMFLEQAFEWENLRYVFYPYFWANADRWPDLADITGADALFAAFLRAGSARVVVPTRPGYEDQVNFYVHTLIPWGGLGAPAPDAPGYLSIADEVQALSGPARGGVPVGSSWEVRLPTESVCLADAGLPVNPHPAIPAPPTAS
ncbi:hypothetical protein [Micromonospora kangleipakensis]|uniref:hypothetical protein n=1 Tax=Micromonospora kangleipakensis TaxID=1077942 RepID=UPI0013EF4175|nr:hypothetical protein [Micromonospora kangleipakensis]